MNRHIAWDDLRIVRAIATAGSLSGAGRSLGLSHATVFRRVNDIERRLGAKLFERGRSGYTATLAGEEVDAAARRVEAEVQALERRIVGRDLRPSGTVRVTTTDALLAGLLSTVFTGFRRAYPDIGLEVAVSNRVFDLSKRETDVAVRPSSAPPQTLVGRRLARIGQAVYGPARAGAARATDVPLSSLDWIGPDQGMAYRDLEGWMTEQGLDSRCRFRVDSVLGMHAGVAADAGFAVLPCYLAEHDARLARIGEPIPALATDLWLLTHPDLRKTARIRALLDHVADAVRPVRSRLAGTA